jgi:hypothetical protein
MVLTRNSSLDLGYQVGDLSVYPEALDDKYQLYQVANNAVTTLKQSLSYAGKYIVAEDNSVFPQKGLLKIGKPPGEKGPFEIIYYDQKTDGVFKSLIRGFAGTRQNLWPVGTTISCAVMAEPHQATRDALIKIQQKMGIAENPDENSLNGILKKQEARFLAPKAIFRAYPIKGPPPLQVRFQNFNTAGLIRYLWDFGDGTTSLEQNPTHIYRTEGIYTVKLNIITALGAQGIVVKSNYITVSYDEIKPFFYVSAAQGYSLETATRLGVDPTEFLFVDQTSGNIAQRYWIFDGAGTSDGVAVETSVSELDPNIHTKKFIYDKPGTYEPSLLVIFGNQRPIGPTYLKDKITVL